LIFEDILVQSITFPIKCNQIFFQRIASKILYVYVTWTKFSWTRILYTTMYTSECEVMF